MDTKYIDSATRVADGDHFIAAIFERSRNERCRAVPVVGLSNDPASLAATAAVLRSDGRGVALRLTLPDFDRPDLSTEIGRVLTTLGVGYADADLIIDVAAPNFQPIGTFVRVMITCMEVVPMLNRWRTFTFAGTSYPPTVAGLAPPFQDVPRQEWHIYRELVNRLGAGTRIPSFGDYAVAHPELVALDMRIIKPFAKLRYTSDNFWHIGKGTNVRTHGFAQYRQLCQTLMDRPCFDGRDYSAGDHYIADCAEERAGTGNLTTWVWVSTNRHLTKVVNDLATFHGP